MPGGRLRGATERERERGLGYKNRRSVCVFGGGKRRGNEDKKYVGRFERMKVRKSRSS